MQANGSDVPPAAADALARNQGIDLLRGLAILLVVLHHTGLRIPLKRTSLGNWLPHMLLDGLNYNGGEAVAVFFVISGFLITRNALGRWGALAAIDMRAFYVRRSARIVPCLLALVAILSVFHLIGVPDYLIKRDGQSLPGAIFAALGLYLNWYEGRTGYLPGGWDVLWSLSIEEVFYLGFPLACLITRRDRVLLPPLVLLALSLPFAHAALAGDGIWQEKAYVTGMAAIATGVIAAMVAQRFPVRQGALALALRIIGCVGLAAVLLVERALWRVLSDGSMLLLTLSVACLLLGLSPSGDRAQARRGFGWLRSWGRLSYEIYLTHMFVVFAVVRVYRSVGSNPAWGFVWYVPALLLCWLLGALVARTFSVPCERWLRQRWLRRPNASVEAASAAG